jgi:hypothetical protein
VEADGARRISAGQPSKGVLDDAALAPGAMELLIACSAQDFLCATSGSAALPVRHRVNEPLANINMRMTGLATALLVTVATIRGERWPVQEQGKASVSVTNPERAPVTIECSPNVVVETAPKVACRVANVGDDAITALDVITRSPLVRTSRLRSNRYPVDRCVAGYQQSELV